MILLEEGVSVDIEVLFHFNSVPEEELKEQYMGLAFAVASSGYGGRFMVVNGKMMKEEASSTLSIEETKRQMQAKFNLREWQITTLTAMDGGVRFVVLYPGIAQNTRLITDAMSACGWSLAAQGDCVKSKMMWNAMSFAPIFPIC
jgi:hypothetical protein